MMGKQLGTVGVLLILGLFRDEPAHAQVTTTVFYGSPYVWRGEVLSRGYVFQPQVTASLGGASLTFFGNLDPRGEGDKLRLNEADLTAAYTLALGRAALSAGYTFYTFPAPDGGHFELDWSPSHEVFASIGTSDVPGLPRLLVAYDFTAYDGLYSEAGLAHNVAVGGHPVNLGLTLGLDAGYVLPDGKVGLSHLALTGKTDFAAGPLTISPLVGFQVSLADEYRAFEGETLFYGGIGLGF